MSVLLTSTNTFSRGPPSDAFVKFVLATLRQLLEEEDSSGALDPLAWPGECQALARGGREEKLRLVRVPRPQGRGHLAPEVLVTPGHQGPQAQHGGRRVELELTQNSSF